MPLVSTKTHGVIDYVTGAGLLAAPKLLGIEDEPAAARVLRGAGAGAVLYSLLTDYELGAVRVIPMRLHLALDAASGALLITSPWLFGFAGRGPRYRLPHLLVGAAEIVAAITSRAR